MAKYYAVRVGARTGVFASWEECRKADDAWKAKLPETKAYRNYVFDSREMLDIKFVKVKGHSGNKYNDRADYLAGKALNV